MEPFQDFGTAKALLVEYMGNLWTNCVSPLTAYLLLSYLVALIAAVLAWEGMLHRASTPR